MYEAHPALVEDMRCGNCASNFIPEAPKMLACIKGGLEKANESAKESVLSIRRFTGAGKY